MSDVRTLFEIQRCFVEEYWESTGVDVSTPEGRRTVLRENVLGAHKQLSDVLAEDGARPHLGDFGVPSVVRGNVAEELVDTAKYLIGIAIAYGIDADEFSRVFYAKSERVAIRRREELALRRIAESGFPAIAVDLDGVLCKYPSHFERWARFRFPDALAAPDGVRFREFFRPDRYEEMKRAYRESGAKATIPAIDGAPEAAAALSEAFGGNLVVLSSRPASDVVRIASDTMRWLDRNDVPRAAVLFAEDKAVYAARRIPTLEVLVDDDREQCVRAALQGVDRVYWVSESGPELADGVRRVPSLSDVASIEIG